MGKVLIFLILGLICLAIVCLVLVFISGTLIVVAENIRKAIEAIFRRSPTYIFKGTPFDEDKLNAQSARRAPQSRPDDASFTCRDLHPYAHKTEGKVAKERRDDR